MGRERRRRGFAESVSAFPVSTRARLVDRLTEAVGSGALLVYPRAGAGDLRRRRSRAGHRPLHRGPGLRTAAGAEEADRGHSLRGARRRGGDGRLPRHGRGRLLRGRGARVGGVSARRRGASRRWRNPTLWSAGAMRLARPSVGSRSVRTFEEPMWRRSRPRTRRSMLRVS